MKYILFAGDFQYPSGGGEDWKASDDDLGVLKAVADGLLVKNGGMYEWAHVMESDTGKIIYAVYSLTS